MYVCVGACVLTSVSINVFWSQIIMVSNNEAETVKFAYAVCHSSSLLFPRTIPHICINLITMYEKWERIRFAKQKMPLSSYAIL